MAEAAPAVVAPVAPAAAGGNNKMMFIMIGAMFVLLLGGMGGMYLLMSKKDEPAEETTTAEKSPKGEKKAAKAEKPTPKAAAIYVGFEPPFVVNFPADSPVKFLQLSVQIMTREASVEHEIKGNDPAIRDALIGLFGQQTAEKLATPEGKEELRAKALAAVRGVIRSEGGEADKVEAVFFTSFVMQ